MLAVTRKRTVTQLPNYHVTCSSVAHFHDVHHEAWTFERMHRAVSQQRATVVFYSLLERALLVWVLQPGAGLVRFYTGRSFKEETMREQVPFLVCVRVCIPTGLSSGENRYPPCVCVCVCVCVCISYLIIIIVIIIITIHTNIIISVLSVTIASCGQRPQAQDLLEELPQTQPV